MKGFGLFRRFVFFFFFLLVALKFVGWAKGQRKNDAILSWGGVKKIAVKAMKLDV